MNYQVQLTRQAVKHIRSLSTANKARIKKALQEMETDPFAGDVKKLSGYDAYRRRIGKHRIIFTIKNTELVVLVFAVLRRDEQTYKKL